MLGQLVYRITLRHVSTPHLPLTHPLRIAVFCTLSGQLPSYGLIKQLAEIWQRELVLPLYGAEGLDYHEQQGGPLCQVLCLGFPWQ